MKKLLLASFGLVLVASPAWAACGVSNLQVKDNAAVTAAVPYGDDGSGGSNCSPQIQIKQGGNVANVDAGHSLQMAGEGTAGSAAGGVVTVQGVASMTPFLVNPGTAANWNTTWAGGTLGSMANYGTSPGAVLVPGVNAFVTNANTNGQQNMANSSPVVLANNQSVGDPCMYQLKSNAAFSTTPNNANVALVTGVSAKKIYVCSFTVIVSAATAISLTEGSSSTCGTSNQAAVMGVASNGTLANGLSLAANGGVTLGSGVGTVAQTATNADYLCIASSSASANVAGNLTYIQQ